MFSPLKQALALAGILTIGGCGLNPIGPGQSSLDMFAKIGKAVQKPSEGEDKSNANNVVQQGTTAAKQLAKGLTGMSNEFRDTFGLTNNGTSYTYWEHVTEKPNDEDSHLVDLWKRHFTGRCEVTFTYNGPVATVPSEIITSSITGILSFHMIGRETKLKWRGLETDTVEATVDFVNESLGDFTPGSTRFWAKNISGTNELGEGDTASFTLGQADADSIQYGAGHFLDAHTGKNQDGDPYAFDFTIKIDHNGTYGDYSDNDGWIYFSLPYGTSGDSLDFEVHFLPKNIDQGFSRVGYIYKKGKRLVHFTHNEQTGHGVVEQYNEDGELTSTTSE